MSQHGNVQWTFDLALAHHSAGRLREADALYREVLRTHSEHAEALHMLGVLAHQVGRNDLAVDLLARASEIDVTNADIQNNLGVALRTTGKLERAVAAHRRAIELRLDHAPAHNNLGTALRDLGQLDAAIASYRRSIEILPEYGAGLNNLGLALQEAGQLSEAIECFRRAVAMLANDVDVRLNLAKALADAYRFEEAVECYQKLLSLRPQFARAHADLGGIHYLMGQMDEAAVELVIAAGLQPDLPAARLNLGNVAKDTGRLDEALEHYRRAVTLGSRAAASNYLYALHFHPDVDAARIRLEHAEWNERFARPLAAQGLRHDNDRSPDRRLRIGYVSAHLRNHPVGRFLLPLYAHHDHTKFEIVCYSGTPREDEITARLRSYTDLWRSTTRMSDERLGDLVREDRIDILIDLAMHLEGSRLLVFARRPAPVQMTYLAYCSTTGLDTIDYRITDSYLDPPTQDRPFYCEKSALLTPSYWCYEPHGAQTVDRSPARDGGPLTFGSLNNYCKVSRPTLEGWANLLRQVPHSRLILHCSRGSHRDLLLQWFDKQEVDPSRLSFIGTLPAGQYFRLYSQIDIALDPFPYTGGTTTCDALWMGVPVVSLAGETAVSRGGLSILSNIGLPELAAANVERYVQVAAGLAADRLRLSQLRSSLRERMRSSPLMNAQGFARNIEAIYRQIWNNWCESYSN